MRIILCILFSAFFTQNCVSQISEVYADGLFLQFTHKFEKDSFVISIVAKNSATQSLYIPSMIVSKRPIFFITSLSKSIDIKIGSDMQRGNYLSSIINIAEVKPGESLHIDTTVVMPDCLNTIFFKIDFISASDLIELKKGATVAEFEKIDGQLYYKKATIFRTVFFCPKFR